jgi:NAD(P)-dependent dehydrogenase (short-subunit alcohol dehydrogenase family)
MQLLREKVALITGAGSGIGKAAAHLLAKEGAKVAALGVTEEEVAETVSQIHRHGGEAISLIADISQPEPMEKAIQQIIDQWGRIDIVFANAGINGVWAPIEELQPSEWDKTLNANLKGTFLTVKYAVPYLKKRGGSVIISMEQEDSR